MAFELSISSNHTKYPKGLAPCYTLPPFILSYLFIRHFFLTYNIHKSRNIKGDYLDLEHNIDNFKVKAIVVIKF